MDVLEPGRTGIHSILVSTSRLVILIADLGRSILPAILRAVDQLQGMISSEGFTNWIEANKVTKTSGGRSTVARLCWR